MAGVKTLADKRIKISVMTVPPADMNALKVAELTAGINAASMNAASSYRFSPSASDTINDPAVDEESTASVPGGSNYEGTLAPFWYLDATGGYVAADNAMFEAVKEKGSEVWVAEREGKPESDPWAAGDVYCVYHFITDNPQKPTDRGGWVKRIVPGLVQDAALYKTVVAGI